MKMKSKKPSYKRGWRDGQKLCGLFSPYFASHAAWGMGFCRKDRLHSETKLYYYCEGLNDYIAQLAVKKGFKLRTSDGRVLP